MCRACRCGNPIHRKFKSRPEPRGCPDHADHQARQYRHASLMFCAASDGRLVTKVRDRRTLQHLESHLAQIINRLAQLGYICARSAAAPGASRWPARRADPRRRGVPPARGIGGAGGGMFCRCRQYLPAGQRLPAARGAADAAEAFYAQLDEVTLDALVCDNAAPVLAPFRSAPARNGLEDHLPWLDYSSVRGARRENRPRAGAEGATAPETLRPQGPVGSMKLWRDPAQPRPPKG